ncbi:hypothetical protein [Paenibacillus daejeonensis]|uniref:hypothetical protein n=1 Tax=Paenibacillus daejeonensis TaxID=135193 RepID=UPI0003784826|nr:hypothetical protein [Paenibacillus daejeonensis]
MSKMTMMQHWMDEAMAQGPEQAKALLEDMAKGLGIQVTRLAAKEEQMPELLSDTIKQVASGVTAGMIVHHGQVGHMHVQMYSVRESQR